MKITKKKLLNNRDEEKFLEYLVYGATDENDPNGDIAVVIDDEELPEESAGADGTSSDSGKGKKN